MMNFAEQLDHWYDENKRSLPWRGENDPYKIWISEIILQQTRVNQGWDYYLRFIAQFPDVKTLATAPLEQVLKIWQGLGYYSRARNLHSAAQTILHEYQGNFPSDYQHIRNLKGIGDYTAAAIASIAFGLPYPAIDGNVFRFVCRYAGIRDNIMLGATRKLVTERCQHLMADMPPGTFNQAMMEFGATHCTPKNPQCDTCPFQSQCYAYKNQVVDLLPVIVKNLHIKKRYFHYLFFIKQQQTLIEQRTANDIWKNLFQLPLIEAKNESFDIKQHLLDKHISYSNIENVLNLKHQLTHQTIFTSFYLVEINEWPLLFPQAKIIAIKDLEQYAVAKPTTLFLQKLQQKLLI